MKHETRNTKHETRNTKHEIQNTKQVVPVVILVLAASLTFNAKAAVSLKCQQVLAPVLKSILSPSATNSEIVTLLEYGKAQCSLGGIPQGRGGGDG